MSDRGTGLYPEVLIRRAGGLRATSRRTGELSEDGRAVAVETIRTGLAGTRVWSEPTKRKLAAAWGVSPGEVVWPDLEDAATGLPEGLTGFVEAEAANATGLDAGEVDILRDEEAALLGERGALRALMLHLGRREVDKVYRQVFGRQPRGHR
jgi:hypothetical protein